MPRNSLSWQALTLAALLAGPVAAQTNAINWQTDIEAAKAVARQSGRLVLVHVWGPECGPCVALEQNVFNQPGVAGVIDARFVPVKLNADENPATAQTLGISRIPTDVILTPDGHLVGRFISPPTPAAYIAEVTQVANQYASRSGQSFASAPSAPQPASINSEYSNLQVPATTSPVASTAPPDDRYASNPGYLPTQTATAGASPFGSAPPLHVAAPTAPHAQTTPAPATPTDVAGAPPAVGHSTPSQQPTWPAATMPPATVAQHQHSPAPAETGVGPAPTPGSPFGPPPNQYVNPHEATTANSQSIHSPASTAPDLSRLPAGAPPLGFDGYCPVSMRRQWQWVAGNPQFGAIHRGRTYWFASLNEQQLFLENPDYYSPALSGVDPVLAIDHRQTVPGRREHSLDYDNQFYLFSSEATLQQFSAQPERYATGVRQAMGIERGRLTR